VGAAVHVERDAEPRDAYGRLLAYVHRADNGLFVNLELVRDGFAVPLTFEPNTAHRDEIVAAATEAEAAGLGLWGACVPSGN
jgi:micrococcal nuclease